MFEKIVKNSLYLSVIAAVLIIAASLIYVGQREGFFFSKNLSAEKVGEIVVDYINSNADLGGNSASLTEVVEESGVYRVTVGIAGQEFTSYASRDGKLLFPESYPLGREEEDSPEEVSLDIPKRERPDVKLFVMSYCPYGLQMEKAYLPVYNLLGDKADLGIYFVDYILHEKKEIDENLRQYCIQKEEEEKYTDYLSCFTVSGDYQSCLTESGINSAILQNCTFETDRDFEITSYYNNRETWLNGSYPKFPIHSDLNDEYGVGGSPTVVINDKVVTVNPRSPENFKNIVCQAFKNEPEECSQALSLVVSSIGFGTGEGSASVGSCQ